MGIIANYTAYPADYIDAVIRDAKLAMREAGIEVRL